MSKEITIKIPQGFADNHIEQIAEKILGGCIGLMMPYDKQRFKLIQHRLESIMYSYIEEATDSVIEEQSRANHIPPRKLAQGVEGSNK